MNDNVKSIFQTDQDTVHAMLNLDIGVNLASIGNKLYLLHCGQLVDPEEVAGTTTTTTTIVSPEEEVIPKVTMAFPNGGEVFEVGDAILIRWTSTESLNDAVKLELVRGDEATLVLTIVSQTSNDGQFEFVFPASVPDAEDYGIIVTWLQAGEGDPQNQDISDGDFSIFATAPEVTTTTTTVIDKTVPDISSCRGIPLIEFAEDEHITDIIKDIAKGGILFSTSKGRVLFARDAAVNAYLTGDRKVFAEVKDGFGNVSDTRFTEFFYGLFNKIVEINADNEVVKFQFEVNPSAIMSDRITGSFLSPILEVKEDLGFWKTLMWQEEKPADTEITICVRAADSVKELQEKPFDHCFISRDSDQGYGSTGVISRDLLNTNDIDGQFIQFKITMTTDKKNTSPSVLTLSISYSTKFAVFFYTTKFSLVNDTQAKTGLMVASITQPQNT